MSPQQTAERQTIGVDITLEREALARLDEEAREAGLTRSELIQRMVEGWIEDEEEDWELARQAKAALADPNDELIPWDEVKASRRA